VGYALSLVIPTVNGGPCMHAAVQHVIEDVPKTTQVLVQVALTLLS